jgi:hypothetical protein
MGTFDIKDFSQGALDYFYSVSVKMRQLSEQSRKKLWRDIIETDDLEKSEAVKKYIPEKYKRFSAEDIIQAIDNIDSIQGTDKEKAALGMFFNVLLLRNQKENYKEELENLKKQLAKKEKELKAKDKQLKDRLHKQPRALLKTVSKNIGKTTGEPGLFSLQNIDTDTPVVKEEISRVASALAFYLMQLYQQNNNEPLEINNLTALSEIIGCKNERLKIYLLYLGGYTYPIIDKNEHTKGFSITNEQMFTIEFHYGEKVAKKYHIENNEIQGAQRIGTNLMNFIKNEPVESITITPKPRFISALQGKGLGNILTVNDKFVGLILQLTDIATKILTYSSSNRQNHTIEEDNFIAHLGLQKQLINQSRPRVRETILKGLEELKTKRHIKSYSFNEITRMYKYTVSEEYVRHKEKKPKED